nr:phosphoribulokinase [Gammaproteobacteria bacterium]
MSIGHPIVAVTGSSGAGTSMVKSAFEHICRREHVNPVIVEGASFHCFDRYEMPAEISKARAEGRNLSHFGPEGNFFDKLEDLFKTYSEAGTGIHRHYLRSFEEARAWQQEPGTFTPWEAIPGGSDLLLYEGLHGGVAAGGIDIAGYVDVLIGVVPIVNLEWIQKIHRDTSERGYSAEAVTDTILRRMHDYVHYIVPQFSRTHINFQRVATVDTSNPFIARDIPTADESFVVIRVRDRQRFDFPYLLNMVHNSFMSRPNTIVVPAGKMGFAMELMLTPLIHELMQRKRQAQPI